MKFKSVKAFLQAANGQPVIRRVEGIPTLDTWEEDKANILANLKKQGAPDDFCTVDSETGDLVLADGRVIFKPKMSQETLGVLQVRSADTVFFPDGSNIGSHGGKTGGKIIDNRFVKDYGNGYVLSYELVDPEV